MIVFVLLTLCAIYFFYLHDALPFDVAARSNRRSPEIAQPNPSPKRASTTAETPPFEVQL